MFCAQANMNSELTSIPHLALVERDSRHKCSGQKELRRYEQRSRFLPNTAFSTPFRGVLPHPTNKSALRAERPTHSLAAKKPGWPPTSTWTMVSLPTPHAPRRQASGVRSCADPPPLATARHRQPNWQRPNGAQSRRSAHPYLTTKALTKKRIWLRHQAVVLAKQGHSTPAIARAFGCSHLAVQAWVGRYNQGGLAALQERPHTGRPPRLAAADVPRFRDRLEAGPPPRMASAPSAVRTCAASWRRNSARALAGSRSMTCCIASITAASCPGPSMNRPTPRSRNSSRRSLSSRSTPSPRLLSRGGDSYLFTR